MLASTVKFSTYNRHPTPTTATPSHRWGPRPEETSHHTPHQPPIRRPEAGRRVSPDPSGPNNVSDTHPKPAAFHSLRSKDHHRVVLASLSSGRCQVIDVPPVSTRCPTLGDRPGS